MTTKVHPAPLGADWDGAGTRFALYSGCAEGVDLCLFDSTGRETARHGLGQQRDGIWHIHLMGIEPGQRYGYRVHGVYEPGLGLRCNPHKLLLDPYARALAGRFIWSPAVYDFLPGSNPQNLKMSHLDSAACVPKSVVTGRAPEPPVRPNIPWSEKVIYEANVRGFTMRHPELPEDERGRLRGLSNAKIIAYLKALGITSIELQPVQAWLDESFLSARGMRNFWGYNPLNFFCVEGRLAGIDAQAEFREMTDALHDAGLEVILDVAYNHTAEGGALGPTTSFRGIDNLAYYRTEENDRGAYVNMTGCGNSLNADHPVFQDLVVDSLAWWRQGLGVDGFRFDLAVTLGRSADGFDPGHPLLERIGSDPRLAGAPLIAEPWDIGHGGYQLGNFPQVWSEWNDRYRDCVRAFWRGDRAQTGAFAERLHGSADVFEGSGRGPRASINFVSSHDGFTLADVVSYEQRHNLANGEDNRDGHSHNVSRNYGAEGPTCDAAIQQLRHKQRLNLLASLLLSQGTPMLLAGDEFGNSQAGNNNAYCQDNETGWLDWRGLTEDRAFTEQVVRLIRLRRETPLLRQAAYIHGHDGPRIDWMHTDGTPMGSREWEQSRSFALMLSDAAAKTAVLILINRGRAGRRFRLPTAPGGQGWQLVFHSSEPEQPQLKPSECLLADRSVACLLSPEPETSA